MITTQLNSYIPLQVQNCCS